ncbi:MAG: hypothetical protein CO186_00740 [Zetaproteobacteria bacterium CG_4_9_14_3_um_filter_49_83]|nr:MAG: hypothetical protein AUJ56_07695 [Zetaproteobacteria bacterium CG1_02_49_23]PIQ33110.1 MAG: hypothetical protein COW62_06195 [Zetaproteobacteria bacterium CG17_big_fil_post_rev_8_21_14_2_50_50_13]PIV29152.1 MAG: hypothetical protein COS35_13565 [Zetaproteobacteria bacterium CG02_land_8_20_14_3_00_50_9]PIY55617.1 MAG: hypothetical protein COZ00_08485 [Zetaproteobacteria bacterium CG_4_10_14_0_8_um_filter_49_80]PJA36425.1 MAG: hypothetical protein CO186_00740 [Zetaproteobacteria bacterium
MPDTAHAFIWYHGDIKHVSNYQQWLILAHDSLNISARLLIRTEAGKTTFMEIFEHMDVEMLENLSILADQQSCFQGIERHVEIFRELGEEHPS